MARQTSKSSQPLPELPALTWQKAAYRFHSYAYRDPRSAFASGIGQPVVSPTTVLLGIVSTLFSLGEADAAQRFLSLAHHCDVIVDAPDGIVFFRAFHQLRRYETMKYGANPRFGLTKINQGTREYGLVDGMMTVYVGVPENLQEATTIALTNIRHLGTSDSLCSLTMAVEFCQKPSAESVTYTPSGEFAQEVRERGVEAIGQSVTRLTLSRFKKEHPLDQTLPHWKMTGDQSDTELLTYIVPGFFEGTTRGRIYRKRRP